MNVQVLIFFFLNIKNKQKGNIDFLSNICILAVFLLLGTTFSAKSLQSLQSMAVSLVHGTNQDKNIVHLVSLISFFLEIIIIYC